MEQQCDPIQTLNKSFELQLKNSLLLTDVKNKIQNVFSLDRLLIVRINTKIANTKRNELVCKMQMRKKKRHKCFFQFNENLMPMQTYSMEIY